MNNELYHHGVLGMKWGVRRYQNYDGTLKNPKRKEHGLTKRLTDNYASSYKKVYGMSDEEAQKHAKERMDLVKKVAIATAIAGGVAGGIYLGRRIGRNYIDETIKAGTTLQTLRGNVDHIDQGRAFYAAHRELDKQKYIGFFGMNSLNFNGLTFNMGYKNKVDLNAIDDIKVAGGKMAKKTYKELMNDPQFYAVASRNYKDFMTYDMLGEDSYVKNKFFDALQKKGYSAVRDFNDAVRSGYNTKATIVFDKSKLARDSSGLLVKNVRQLNANDVMSGRNKAIGAMVRDALIDPTSVTVGASYVGLLRISKYDKKIYKKYAHRRAK